MIWCRFEKDGKTAFGIVENDTVTAISGTPFEDRFEVASARYPLQSVKLLPPVIPRTFFVAGLNYTDHVIKAAARHGKEPKLPKRPDVNFRAVGAIIGPDDNIIKPTNSGPLFQYEGELVAVIGRRARNVSKGEALDYVLGWTIGNDVSERDWQSGDRTNWRAKNTDTFNPMGPWIVTGLDVDDMTTIVRLNGVETDRFKTGNMLYDVATYVSEVSKYMTMQPGDVLWMGTEGAPKDMKPGDTIEIEITGIGILRNYVIAED